VQRPVAASTWVARPSRSSRPPTILVQVIRTASLTDLPVLRDIERAAGEPFRALDMATIADDEPPTIGELTEFQRAGRAWVWVDGADHPAAYVLTDVIDGYAHIEQVSVHPGHSRRGVGSALMDHVAQWGAARDLAGLTLTTFANVPWNAPYYERLGFRVLADDELSPGLREIRANEAGRGLDAWPRVAMRRTRARPGGHGGVRRI